MKLKDKKIRVLKLFSGVNENGFRVEEWRPLHSGRLWAYYRQLSGSEFYSSAMVNAAEEVVFTINWRNDVDTDILVEYNGRFYDITRVDDFEGYKNELNIFCKLSQDQNITVEG